MIDTINHKPRKRSKISWIRSSSKIKYAVYVDNSIIPVMDDNLTNGYLALRPGKNKERVESNEVGFCNTSIDGKYSGLYIPGIPRIENIDDYKLYYIGEYNPLRKEKPSLMNNRFYLAYEKSCNDLGMLFLVRFRNRKLYVVYSRIDSFLRYEPIKNPVDVYQLL